MSGVDADYVAFYDEWVSDFPIDVTREEKIKVGKHLMDIIYSEGFKIGEATPVPDKVTDEDLVRAFGIYEGQMGYLRQKVYDLRYNSASEEGSIDEESKVAEYTVTDTAIMTEKPSEKKDYGETFHSTILKIFGDEVTYNVLSFYAKDKDGASYLETETNVIGDIFTFTVWIDRQVLMEKKYSIHHTCDMFRHLSEIDEESETEESEVA